MEVTECRPSRDTPFLVVPCVGVTQRRTEVPRQSVGMPITAPRTTMGHYTTRSRHLPPTKLVAQGAGGWMPLFDVPLHYSLTQFTEHPRANGTYVAATIATAKGSGLGRARLSITAHATSGPPCPALCSSVHGGHNLCLNCVLRSKARAQ